ncbi:MAG: hypothetical protein ACRCU3_10940 [Eubacteriaceae bacterium]
MRKKVFLDDEIVFTLKKNFILRTVQRKVLWGWESIPKRINSEASGIKNQFHRLELIPSKEIDSSESLANCDEKT